MNKINLRILSVITAITLALGSFTSGQARASSIVGNNPGQVQNQAYASATLPPVITEADTRVNQNNPDTNYGTYGAVLYVKGGVDANIESFLRFTVSGVNSPVTSARLRIYVTEGTANGPAAYVTANTWTETGLTWNNRTARTSKPLDDKAALAADAWAEFDVTAAVTGNGTYSFILASDNADGMTLSAREGTNAPQLVITVADAAPAQPTVTLPPAASPTPLPGTNAQATPTLIAPTVTPTTVVPSPTAVPATATPTTIVTGPTAVPATATPTTVVTGPTAMAATPTTVPPSPTAIQPTATPITASQSTVPNTLPASGTMWISQAELLSLPTTGAAWDRIRNTAYGAWGTADLKNQDNKHSIYTLAGALVYARTGDPALQTKVRDAVLAAKRTLDESAEWQTTNGVLATGRQLGAYVIAADLINLKKFDSVSDTEFRNWLATIRTTNIGTHSRWKSLNYTCENATANWSAFACASRIAAGLYLGDGADVQRAANVIRALLGERTYYPANAPGTNGYFQHTADYQTTWSCNETAWTGINPPCAKSGVNLDGALIEDASRGGACCLLQGAGVSYSWEALQGYFVSAELLYRAGAYGDPYSWSNQALKRSLDFLQRSGWGITGVAAYVPWMANLRYKTTYPVTSVSSGRIMSWGDWLYKR